MPSIYMNALRGIIALRRQLRVVAQVVTRIIGAPDYERYVAYMQRAHPGSETLSPDEFTREVLERRFERPGQRCC